MIKLTIKDKEYLHPSKMEEVTLNHWIGLTSSEDDIENFSNFANIPIKVLMSVDPDDVYNHIDQTYKMIQVVTQTASDLSEPIESFKVDRSTYYVPKDFNKKNFGMYLDSISFMSQMRTEEFYAYMMAIYCLKKGEEVFVDSEQLEKRANIMRKVDILTALRVNGFFLTSSKAYQKDTLLCSQGSLLVSKFRPGVLNYLKGGGVIKH